MELLDVLQSVSKAENFKETSNYYYQNHICAKSGDNKKVQLDYTLSNDITDDIVRFGVCEDCLTCFYHKDYQSKGF